MPTPRAECPAVAELRRAIHAVIPSVILGTIREDGSRHTSGIAIDIMLDSRAPDEKALADAIIDALVECHAAVKWSDLIYTDWNADGTPSYFHMPAGVGGYGGNRFQRNAIGAGVGSMHVNHIHLDWVDFSMRTGDPTDPYAWSTRARATGFSADFQAALQRRIGDRPLAGADGRAPSWLLGWWHVVEHDEDYYYYVGEAGYAYWSATRPASPRSPRPVVEIANRAIYSYSGQTGVRFAWDHYGTIETFTSRPPHRTMAGVSNRNTKLTATKL